MTQRRPRSLLSRDSFPLLLLPKQTCYSPPPHAPGTAVDCQLRCLFGKEVFCRSGQRCQRGSVGECSRGRCRGRGGGSALSEPRREFWRQVLLELGNSRSVRLATRRARASESMGAFAAASLCRVDVVAAARGRGGSSAFCWLDIVLLVLRSLSLAMAGG